MSGPVTPGSNKKAAIMFAVLVPVAGYVMLWRPQATKLDEAGTERAFLQVALAEAQDELNAAKEVPVVVAEDPAAVPFLVAVPATVELPSLLRTLDAMAVESGLAMSSITPALPAVQPSGPGESVLITISGSGAKESVYAFIDRVRTLDRLLVVEQTDLTEVAEGAEGEPAGGLQLQLSLRAFSAAIPVVVPGADSGDGPGGSGSAGEPAAVATD
jgi:Tfp pilus assembly protein PilO